MTVSSYTCRNSYVCNGSTTVFPYTFRILDEDHLQVILQDSAGSETVLTKTTHYTVSGVDEPTGGNVTTVLAYAFGHTLIFLRNVPIDQETDYVENDEFPAESHEEALDKLTMICQQMNEQVGRSLKVAKSSTLSGSALDLIPVASRIIGWDAVASAVTTYPVTPVYSADFELLHDDYGNDVATAITAIGSGHKTVVIDRNTNEITADLTSPANIVWFPVNGGMFNVGAGKTLTIASPGNLFASPVAQVFSGAGTVLFAANAMGGSIYPGWFGAKGDGVTDDTSSIQKALDSRGHSSHQVLSALWIYSMPAVVFPSGKYLITDTIKPSHAAGEIISYEDAIIYCNDATKDIFDFTGGYNIKLKGLKLVGGKRQIAFGNNNIYGSLLLLEEMEFHGNSSAAAVDLFLVAPATNLSLNVIFDRCNFNDVYQCVASVPGVEVVVTNTYVGFGNIDYTGRAAFVNKGLMIFDRMYGNPCGNTSYPGARWVDNYSEFTATNSRFGGEGAGQPFVYQYEVVWPWSGYLGGGSVILKNNAMVCGNSGVENCIITLMTGIPGLISIEDNSWIYNSAQDFIRIDASFDAAAYINALNVLYDRIYINVNNNSAHWPLETIGLPATLTNTAKRNVIVNNSFKPYMNGYKKRSLLHLDGPNLSQVVIDEYFGTWGIVNTTLTTAAKRFGITSFLGNGTNSYLVNTEMTSLGSAFTIEGWFFTTDVTKVDQTLICWVNASGYGVSVSYNPAASVKMSMSVSSNGTSWDVANVSLGAKVDWVNNTWYKFALEFTGSAYVLYIGISGSVVTADITVISSSAPCTVDYRQYLGCYLASAGWLSGGLDEIRITLGEFRYGGLFIPESEAFKVD